MACILGNATPSPSPISARTSSNAGSQRVAALHGVKIVNKLQTTTPQLKTSLGG
eukprot:CAMPEP_0119102348 /NCGR_PEP_ID=MMETSP1180-20130426/1124_1 /TAXON_ID=3052 ORGANISM="Chlamydomonas cf sp, Strain CCMP681" /NCGR_SAMPLE_ID=MMETSP1180 /ASSEMBLY_ACC=CAM_ASM_000741 /LENGTH=53 /DNA_ID=CAMNT_0007086615 /DNA_START=1457 /DNA_END=1618 /DNA_ORIENTATION=-